MRNIQREIHLGHHETPPELAEYAGDFALALRFLQYAYWLHESGYIASAETCRSRAERTFNRIERLITNEESI